MKKILTLALASLSFSVGAFATELESATNQQLLNELALRLRVGDSTPSSAQMTFSCAGNYNFTLFMTSFNSNGDEASSNIYIGRYCKDVAANLQTRFARITQARVLAICANNYNFTLYRYSLVPQGTIKQLSSLYIGNDCQAQADAINSQ